ncbi:hypothetical protein EV281_101415 [Rhizobium sp. BK418]|nr:hypothetical protein EV281_101415 [Rhizobium sp. BK418]
MPALSFCREVTDEGTNRLQDFVGEFFVIDNARKADCADHRWRHDERALRRQDLSRGVTAAS